MRIKKAKLMFCGHIGRMRKGLDDIYSQEKKTHNLVDLEQGTLSYEEKPAHSPDTFHNQTEDASSNLNTTTFFSSSSVCSYFDNCNIKLFGGNCADYENCQTWRFYHKYNLQPDEFLGTGASDTETAKRIRGKIEKYFKEDMEEF